MAENELITAERLEQFKAKQEEENALTYLAHIVCPTLPTTFNYEGRMAFPVDEGRLYVYTKGGWQKVPWLSEVGSVSALELDEKGDLMPIN